MAYRKAKPTTIKGLCKAFNKVTARNFQNLIAICGTMGVGKTTFAIDCAKEGDKDFTLERNVLFNPTLDEIMKKIRELPYGAHIVLDEAVNICYKMEWFREDIRLFGKFLNLCRKERKTIYFCIPNFKDISRNIRENVGLWIQILRRGEAVILAKSPLFMAGERWDLRLMEKTFRKTLLMGKSYSEIDVNDIIHLLRGNPHYTGELKFLKLPKRMEAEYEILRDREKYEGIDFSRRQSKGKLIYKKFCFLLDYLGFTQVEIGKLAGVSDVAIGYAIKNLDEKIKSSLEDAYRSILENRSKRRHFKPFQEGFRHNIRKDSCEEEKGAAEVIKGDKSE